MREILFRGKRVDNGEWVEGYYVYNGKNIIVDTTKGSLGFGIQIDYKTRGEFTGLTDKNGKKIFEGDFVCLDEDVKKIFGVDDGVIKWNGACFLVAGSNAGILESLHVLTDMNWVLRGAVIGNIHDNPELLEV